MDISNLATKDDVGILKTDVSVLKSDVKTLKTDVSVLKDDVRTLKVEVKALKVEVKGLRREILRIEERVENLEEGQKRLEEKFDARFDKVMVVLDGIAGAIDDLRTDNTVGTHHAREIHVRVEEHEKRIKHLESATL